MDLLHPQKKDAFQALVAGFSPDSLKTIGQVITSDIPPSLLARYVDQDTARLDALSRALKSRRNDCAPLLSIPSEVIRDILEFCSFIEPPGLGLGLFSRKPQKPTIGFIRLGHVCARLRHIMLNIPTLWAGAAFLLPKACEELISRANGVPLTIYVMSVYSAFGRALDNGSAQAHLGEARAIFMDIHSFMVAKQNAENPDDPSNFPSLHELALKSDRVASGVPSLAMSAPMIQAPLLRHLTLDNCFIRCDFGCLNSLNLRFHHRERSMNLVLAQEVPPVDAGTLFGLLGHLNSLKTLKLSGNLLKPFSQTASLQGHYTVSLPRLDNLWVNTEHGFCDSLLTTLAIPSLARLTIDLDVNGYREGQYSTWAMMDLMLMPANAATPVNETMQKMQLLENVIHHIVPSGALPLNGIRLEYATSRLSLFKTEKGAFNADSIGPLSQDHVLVGDVYMQLRDPLVLLERAYQHLEMHPPLTLDLSGRITSSSARWRQIMSRYDAVHTLVLDVFPPPAGLWKAICPTSISDAELPDAQHEPLLPNLKVVFFLKIKDFTPPSPPPPLTVIPHDPVGSDGEWESEGDVGDGGADVPDAAFMPPEAQVWSGDEDSDDETDIDGHSADGSRVPQQMRPWTRLVDGLRLRAQLGLGIERVVLGSHSVEVEGSFTEQMQMLKEDLQAVVADVMYSGD
ncbi:hypothetical protein PENSPDRAFT_754803 [Peniophora sp. CONT]|nr:hypothetical protein PENSPDRAFT_754803 [Peniophora sp. CONT]